MQVRQQLGWRGSASCGIMRSVDRGEGAGNPEPRKGEGQDKSRPQSRRWHTLPLAREHTAVRADQALGLLGAHLSCTARHAR